MNHHVFHYFMNKLRLVDTGCPMHDYCVKDVYSVLAIQELKLRNGWEMK